MSYPGGMIKDIETVILSMCDDYWKNHITLVVHYSKLLASKLGADEEVCEVAAWLHDISKLKGEKDMHHVTGAKYAEELLKNYKNKEQVKHCILTHSSDKNYLPQTLEAEVVMNADALSIFDSFTDMAEVTLVKKGLRGLEAKEDILRKYEKAWAKITLPEAKQIAKEKYQAVQLLLT